MFLYIVLIKIKFQFREHESTIRYVDQIVNIAAVNGKKFGNWNFLEENIWFYLYISLFIFLTLVLFSIVIICNKILIVLFQNNLILI